MRKLFMVSIVIGIYTAGFGQPLFTKEDSLRGSLNEHRDWFDIQHYDITVEPNFENKTLQGIVNWQAIAVKKSNQLQIDLQSPLIIDSIHFINAASEKTSLSFTRNKHIALVQLNSPIPINTLFNIAIYYHGKPQEAIRPPWDGGWIWKKDTNGKPWMSVACQGLGASVWYPCKDHQSDEPDKGARLTMIVPDTLKAIGNGKLLHLTHQENKAIYTWEVKNPINNYNIIPYIGDYVHWTENYNGLKGNLVLEYWALKEDLPAAKKQFTQVPTMLKAFEYWMGPYPFYEDDYKLIQSPHLGMEHQSAIAYGNKFMNGYMGRDLSGTGWGNKWDFIIVHESGHEWFANNISTKDLADMWVHEGFTNYSETLFTEYYYGKKAGQEYNFGIRKNIVNDRPIIGYYNVNHQGSGDMYYKGSNMIQTIRHAINNDTLFRKILIGLNKDFYHQTVTSKMVETYISLKANFNFTKVFDQYLRTTQIPILSYQYDPKEKILTYQWKNCVVGFDLPLKFAYLGKNYQLIPTEYQPQKRLIDQPNFDIKDFMKTIEGLYYIKIEAE